MIRLALGLAALACASTALAQTNPSAFTTGFRYDKSQQLTGTISPDPDGAGAIKYAAVRNTYNAQGWLTKVEKGELTSWQSEGVAPANWTGFTVFQTIDYTYDVGGRRIKESLSGGGSVQTLSQTSFDTLDRPVCVAVRMDPNQWASQADACVPQTNGPQGPDRISKTFYDSAGRVTKIEKAVLVPNQHQVYVSYTYTPNGKQASVTDANQNTAALAYDGLDRLYRWYLPSKTTALTASTDDFEEYHYDAANNRIKLRKRDGRIFDFTYDPRNRMAIKVVPDNACIAPYSCTGLIAAQSRDVFYGYNNRSLQLFARFDSISGEGVTNTYDNAGRLSSGSLAVDGVTRTLGYSFDEDGNRNVLTHPDGTLFWGSFDGLDRYFNAGWRTISDWWLETITYDSQGRRAELNRGNVITNYSYDNASRLSGMATEFNGTAQDLTTSLSYNPASQIIVRTRSNDSYVISQAAEQKLYNVNGLNQYTAVGGQASAYDSNGNLTVDPTSGWTYGYDAENRLVSATTGGVARSLKYDPLGRLYEVAAPTGTTRFLYDGDQLVAEYDAAGALLRRYAFGPGVDEPNFVDLGGLNCSTTRFLQADQQGSIIAASDCAANAININTYDDWGNPGASNWGRFQYTGQAWLGEIGLFHYKARIYSSRIGRFLQVDPVGYDDQVNLYAYVANDPMNGKDPEGTICIGCVGLLNIAIDEVKEDPLGVAFDVGMVVLDIANVPSGESIAIIGARRTATSKGAQLQAEGVRRERQIASELRRENPNARVQNQSILRDSSGRKVLDPETKTGRRVDHAVIENGKARTVETTSPGADKTQQLAKEGRIREQGGEYIRDRETGQICRVEGVSEVRRCK